MPMELLTTSRYREYLFDALRGANTSVWLAAAYITVPGIEPILDLLGSTAIQVKVLARWDSRDLVSGASDLEVYEIVSARGFEFFINQRLHGKCALIDDGQLFVGSSNLTASGLQLGIQGNLECGTMMEPTEADRATIQDLFAGSIRVTPSLYLDIQSFIVPLLTASERRDIVFPASIMEQLQRSVEGLWVRELPWTEGPRSITRDEPDARHDLMLLNLGLGASPTTEALGSLFERTRCCRWLTSQVRDHGGQLYFGEATELLHGTLLEDPKPYRKDVKLLLRNLFAWAAATLPSRFVVDAPHYSQRISLAEPFCDSDGDRLDSAHEAWIARMLSLRRDEIPGRWGDETKSGAPHKPLLLLSVLRNLGVGLIPDTSKIELNSDLEASFYALWYALFQSERATNIALPFLHLSFDGVWGVIGADGAEIDPASARSLRYLKEIKACAQLEPSLCALLTSPEFRKNAEDALLGAYFSEKAELVLRRALKSGGKVGRDTGEPRTSALD
jgi:hypothetical protein